VPAHKTVADEHQELNPNICERKFLAVGKCDDVKMCGKMKVELHYTEASCLLQTTPCSCHMEQSPLRTVRA
jgi:hypothetical protein